MYCFQCVPILSFRKTEYEILSGEMRNLSLRAMYEEHEKADSLGTLLPQATKCTFAKLDNSGN